MPPLPSPGKVVKMQISGTNEGGEFTNIHHISYTGTAPTTAVLAALEAEERSYYTEVYVNGGVDTLQLTEVVLTDLSSDTGAVSIAHPVIVGTLTGAVCSINNAVCVSWPILRRYRGGHPRTYLALGSSSTLEGTSTINWQNSFVDNIVSNLTTWQLHLAGYTTTSMGVMHLCNVSYYSGGAIRDTPLVDILQPPVAKYRVCSQRRRLGKVGG